MTYFNEFGQARLGWRTGGGGITPSTLWNSIYSVYNADSVGSSSLKTSLYAVYNGESNANDSFGSNNGTAVGGLTYTTGKIGNAFSFNGTNSRVDFGNAAFNFGTDSFSISTWFYPNSGNVLQCLVNKGLLTAAEKGFNLFIDNRYNSNQRGISFAVGGGSGNYQQFSTTNQYTIGAWNHIICIWDAVAKTIKIYLNGIQATTTITQTGGTGLASITDITNTVRTGQFGAYGTFTNWFNGRMDATTIWNRELSASEITELFNSGNGSQYITDNFYKPTTNDALNTYNGTAQGGLTYGVGKVGTAFQFNGTNAYVDMGDVLDIGLSSWTYSMWINANDVSSGLLFAKVRAAGLNGRVWAGFNGGKLYFAFDVSNGLSIVIQTTTTYSTNTWYNFTCVLDRSSNLKMYVNGSLASYTSIQHSNDMTPYTSTNYNNNTPFRFGCFTQSDNVTPYAFYNGRIDAFNAWNRVLTTTEITELYNSGNGKQYPN